MAMLLVYVAVWQRTRF